MEEYCILYERETLLVESSVKLLPKHCMKDDEFIGFHN